jgi:hypothetical protein
MSGTNPASQGKDEINRGNEEAADKILVNTILSRHEVIALIRECDARWHAA